MDPRPHLFAAIEDATVTAVVEAAGTGIVTPIAEVVESLTGLGCVIVECVSDGDAVEPGGQILAFSGTPLQVALAEERAIGILAKPSGIATATRQFVERAGDGLRVVSGAWKKLPFSQKEMIRSAIVVGGADPRIAEWPFAYLDKNFVRMLGGPLQTLAAADGLDGYRRVIQLEGGQKVARQAVDAAMAGADILFVDSGRPEDIVAATDALRAEGLRDDVEVAFGGGITLDDIDGLRALDLDTVDVGRPIVDAPLLDMRVVVQTVRTGSAA